MGTVIKDMMDVSLKGTLRYNMRSVSEDKLQSLKFKFIPLSSGNIE